MDSRCDVSAGEDWSCVYLVACAVHGLSLIRVEHQLARAHAGAGRQALIDWKTKQNKKQAVAVV